MNSLLSRRPANNLGITRTQCFLCFEEDSILSMVIKTKLKGSIPLKDVLLDYFDGRLPEEFYLRLSLCNKCIDHFQKFRDIKEKYKAAVAKIDSIVSANDILKLELKLDGEKYSSETCKMCLKDTKSVLRSHKAECQKMMAITTVESCKRKPNEPKTKKGNKSLTAVKNDSKKTVRRRGRPSKNQESNKQKEDLICWDCDVILADKSIFESHMSEHHALMSFKEENDFEAQKTSEKQLLTCDFCLKCFKSKRILASHIKSAHGDLGYSCLTCAETFSNGRLRDTHCKECPKPPVKEIYICDFCDAEFSKKSKMLSHLYVHCEWSRFGCGKCDFGANNRSRVAKHQEEMKHKSEMRMNGYKFKDGEKERFERLAALVENPYAGAERYYECRVCNDKFGEQRALYKHCIKKRHNSSSMVVHVKTDKFVLDLDMIGDDTIRDYVKSFTAALSKQAKKENVEPPVIAGVKYQSRDVAINLWCKESGKCRFECATCGVGFSGKIKALRHAIAAKHNAESIVENLPLFDTTSANIGQSYKSRYRKNSLDYLRNPNAQNIRPNFGVKPELPLERLLFNNLKGTLKKPAGGSQSKPRILNMRKSNVYQPHRYGANPYYGRKRKYHIELAGYEDEDDPGFVMDCVKAELNPDVINCDNQNLGVLMQTENENGERVLMLEGNFQVEDDVNLYMDDQGNIISQDADGNCVKIMQAVIQE